MANLFELPPVERPGNQPPNFVVDALQAEVGGQ
jgi:hypothetical protein